MITDPIKKAKEWAENAYFDKESRNEIVDLLSKNDLKEITERFHSDLEFGTGGLRSIIGFGSNRINIYTIRKATQALANEILKSNNKSPKVVISYDSRRFSFEFAKETASVLAANNIKALIFPKLNPVPLLSFAVRDLKADAGVMITASHNPSTYNGYKVYWNDGCQVTPPIDKNIIANYQALINFNQVKTMEFPVAFQKGLIDWVPRSTEDSYFEKVKSSTLNQELCKEKGHSLKIIYTPIHGTGLIPCERVLKEKGFSNLLIVQEQSKPDSSFSTVKYPNPEDPQALSMAVDLMKKQNGDIVFGTDPDTDRLGVAIIKNKEVFYPNGNQIGILMLHYILSNSKLPKNPFIIKTIVTSELLSNIAKSFGVKTYNTLTGFKWICAKLSELDESGFLFATEESFGYLNHPFVRDKDGVNSVALMAEVALWNKIRGKDLVDALDEIYEKFGFSHESLLSLDYFGKEGSEKISKIMDFFRRNPKIKILDEEIEKIEDYQSGTITNAIEGTTEKLNFPKSNVLGLIFKSKNKIYLRPSGTEPKIKFYLMIVETNGSLSEKKQKAFERTKNITKFLKETSEKA
jgi:phosphoglucomutase